MKVGGAVALEDLVQHLVLVPVLLLALVPVQAEVPAQGALPIRDLSQKLNGKMCLLGHFTEGLLGLLDRAWEFKTQF